jgi:thiamine-phosphate pyrophosphorylase
MPLFATRLLPITDVRISGLSHAEQVRRLCVGGATLVQLREKHLGPREFYREAEAALRVARSFGARIIINDRVDLALALKADGVHLGQHDLPSEAARKLLGDGAIIGFSTHNPEEAWAAANLPVDYLGVGPIFSTSTKVDPAPVVGLEGLRQIRRQIKRIPLVAIGGIRRERAADVMAAGADAVALISGLLEESSLISRRTEELLARL